MTTRATVRWLLPLAIASLVAVLAWWATCFLCDDAFIAFRYVGQVHDGHGLVWNEAPWQPVEGYSSFLWVVMLLAVWNTIGAPPPASANVLSLLCALATLLLVARRLDASPLPPALARARAVLSTIVLLGIAANHTWITWQSSGLDAALFGVLAVGWTLSAAGIDGTRPRDLLSLSAWAALAQLARPDGGLLVLATIAIAVHAATVARARWWRTALALWPLLLPAAHLLWRRAYYGEWLPNTYFAKVGEAWPESGLRYAYCFAFEHGLWLWLPLLLLWLALVGRRRERCWRAATARAPAAIAIAAWAVYAGFYTLRVGGDHFGYRPFMHFVPLLLVAARRFVADLGLGVRAAAAVLLLLAVGSGGFGWWYEHVARGREVAGYVAVGRRVPSLLEPVFARYDRYQAWLRLHLVGIRRAQHAAMCEDLQRRFPPRGAPVANWPPGRRGVLEIGAAGVGAWRAPQFDVIDIFGLNDWVVARNKGTRRLGRLPEAVIDEVFRAADANADQRLAGTELEALGALGDRTWHHFTPDVWAELLGAGWDPEGDGLDLEQFRRAVWDITDARLMAHERQPPPGYVEALRPCVRFVDGRFELAPEVPPIDAAGIEAVERRFRARIAR
ncbi:MAG TPA: hypothetical protein VFZ65_20425 [Planctomycetota bacterium]|nr:hypothetical protein [Planctomycetota bacterium]